MLVLIQSSDTLLQSKQRFIYLGSVNTGLLLELVRVVCSSLAACQVDETDLAVQFRTVFLLEA